MHKQPIIGVWSRYHNGHDVQGRYVPETIVCISWVIDFVQYWTTFLSYLYQPVVRNYISNSISLGGAEPVQCSDQLAPPTNVTASATSYNSILVFWQKPYGTGYKYKVTYKAGDGQEKINQGNLGASVAGSETLTGLDADTSYTITVQLSCDGETFSNPSDTTTVKTLKAGLFLYQFSQTTLVTTKQHIFFLLYRLCDHNSCSNNNY